MNVFNYKYKIKYSDINRNNKLNLKSLVSILQEAASSHSSQFGYGVNDIPKTHSSWVILNWKVQLLMHPHIDEILSVQTWVRKVNKLYFYRDFEVYDGNNNLIAIASSKWILIDTETKKVKKITPEIINAHGDLYEKNVFDTSLDEKVNPPDNMKLNFSYIAQRRDIDTNGHVNNLHYIDFALETLDEKIFFENEFDNLEIVYKKEIKYKEKINCYYSFEDNKHIVTIKSEDNSIIHAIIKLY